jgi:hypothetical protein
LGDGLPDFRVAMAVVTSSSEYGDLEVLLGLIWGQNKNFEKNFVKIK